MIDLDLNSWMPFLAGCWWFFFIGMAGYPCCCRTGCFCCDNGTPNTIVVRFTGAVNDDCVDCADWNRSEGWVTTRAAAFDTATICEWQYSGEDPLPCGASNFRARLECAEGPDIEGNIYYSIMLVDIDQTDSVVFGQGTVEVIPSDGMGYSIDCNAMIQNINSSAVTSALPGDVEDCDFNSATANWDVP